MAVEVAIVGTICATNAAIRGNTTCHQEGMATEDTVVRNVPRCRRRLLQAIQLPVIRHLPVYCAKDEWTQEYNVRGQ